MYPNVLISGKSSIALFPEEITGKRYIKVHHYTPPPVESRALVMGSALEGFDDRQDRRIETFIYAMLRSSTPRPCILVIESRSLGE